jgi:hypothetical protein
MTEKWCQFNDWHVRLPGGASLNLNSEAAADYVLSLVERVQVLEAQQRKREQRHGRKRAQGDGNGDDDGDS